MQAGLLPAHALPMPTRFKCHEPALNLSALAALPSTVARPNYARDALRAGILHIGVGNFHRAHQAVYLDDLFNRGRDLDWALLGAGVRAGDQAMRSALAPQDWLTTVVELEPGGNSARVTGAMTGFVPVGEDAAAIVDALDDAALRIVSLTVTEGGYCIDPATGSLQSRASGHPLRCRPSRQAEGRVRRAGLRA